MPPSSVRERLSPHGRLASCDEMLYGVLARASTDREDGADKGWIGTSCIYQ